MILIKSENARYVNFKVCTSYFFYIYMIELRYSESGDLMVRLNNFLKQNIQRIFIIFLFLQPIIDVLTAVMLYIFKQEFTIGMIFRIIFLLLMIYYFLFISHENYHKKIFKYLIIIGIYFGLFSLNIIYTKGFAAFSYEVKNLIKTFYFPILLVVIYDFLKNNYISVKSLNILFIIYASFIAFPNLLGIGFDTYQITKSGSIGFFYTANEIGAIISILLPFFICFIVEKKNVYLTFIGAILLLYILTSMGTKGPLLSLGIISLYYIIKYLYINIKSKKYGIVTLIITTLIIISFSLSLIIPKTNFYKNIVVHLNFLEVKEVSDIVTNPKVIDHFIFSQRLSFWQKTSKIYKKSNLTSKLLGIGYIDNYGTDQVNLKLVEMDYIDIFYRHGIIGFIIYMSSYIYFIIKILKKYISKEKNNLLTTYLLSFFLIIVLAFITGHVITAPSVSILVALIFNLFYNELYKGES